MASRVRANSIYCPYGAAGAGYKIYTYENLTVTPKVTHNNAGAANANPVVLDARGEAHIRWTGIYTVVTTDAIGFVLSTTDNYGSGEDTVPSGSYNVLLNGNFETDSNADLLPDNWTTTVYPNVSFGIGTATLDTITQIEGAKSFRFFSLGDGGGYSVSDFFNVRETETLAVSWMMICSVADTRNLVEVLWYSASQVATGTTVLYDDSTTNPTAWKQKAVNALVPASARYAKIRITGCHSSDATSGTANFDDIRVTSAVVNSLANVFTGDNTMNGSMTYPVTGGTATVYTVPNSVITGYVTNAVYEVRIHADNTGAATINFNSQGAKNILLYGGTNPRAGDLLAGKIATLLYDGTSFLLQNPRLSIPSGSIVGIGGTGATAANIILDGGSASAGGPLSSYKRNSIIKFNFGTESAIIGNNSDACMIYADTNIPIKLRTHGGGGVFDFTTAGQILWTTVATGGTANAGTATLGETVYTNGRIYEAKITTSNAAGALTMNFDALGVKSVFLLDGTNPLAGQQRSGMVAKWLYDGTNLVLLNPHMPNFRGCLAYMTANTAITDATYTHIPLGAENYDTSSIHDNATNSQRLTVPSGVTRVRMSGLVMFASSAIGVREAYISYNDETGVPTGVTGLPLFTDTSPAGAYSSNLPLNSAVVSVTGGDFFTLCCYQNSGGNLNALASLIGFQTYLAMEIIE